MGRGDGSEDESDNLAFDKVEVNRYGKTQMTPLGQVQEFYVDLWNENAVGYALRDVPEVEREAL